MNKVVIVPNEHYVGGVELCKLNLKLSNMLERLKTPYTIWTSKRTSEDYISIDFSVRDQLGKRLIKEVSPIKLCGIEVDGNGNVLGSYVIDLVVKSHFIISDGKYKLVAPKFIETNKRKSSNYYYLHCFSGLIGVYTEDQFIERCICGLSSSRDHEYMSFLVSSYKLLVDRGYINEK